MPARRSESIWPAYSTVVNDLYAPITVPNDLVGATLVVARFGGTPEGL